MEKTNRIFSIDIMRGLTLFLMLFVNDLYVPGVPHWMVHTAADFDGMGLADWVFPGFLFIVGLSIQYAINSRIKEGKTKKQIFGHVVIRTLSLLLIGVLMLNSERLNPELSGIKSNLWAISMYVSVFLIWNKYPANEKLKTLFFVLRIIGIAGLALLAIVFRAGEPGNISWFHTEWWGILGLIGWGYFVAASVNLLIGPRLWPTVAVWLFFIMLNILSSLGLTDFLDFIKPVFGVIINGDTPSVVLAGLVISIILKQGSQEPVKKAAIIILIGVFSIVTGFFLRHWFIISKIQGTPSWTMICNGISMIIFSILYLIIDIRKKVKWASVFKPAGQNSLTTYLAPDIIYYAVWTLGLPLFFYKQDVSQWMAVLGSLGWALAMVGFAALLARINIRLRL
jgi:heparan-alpha-glucosaminide N-acetyltransferase